MIDIADVVRKQIALYRAYDIRAEHPQRSGRGKEGKLSFGPYLLINTAELTVEAATEISVAAVQRKLALQIKGSG